MIRRSGRRRRRSAALAGVWAHRDLRRLTLAWGTFFLVDWTSWVALSVWAFDKGGRSAVGVVGICRLLPSALALPVGAWAADRFARRRVVVSVFAGQAVALAALIAVVSTDSPLVIVYPIVAIGGIIAAPYRPAHLAMLPLVARTAEELVAANVAAGVFEGVATLGGPALAGVLLLGGGPTTVLIVAAVAAVLGVVALIGVRPATDPSLANKRARQGPLAAVLGGFAVLRHDAAQALIVASFVTQLFVRGLLTVLLVVVSFDLLDLGESGVGWLGAAMGVGGTVGAAVTVRLTGRRQLGRPFAVGLVLWGAPIAAIGLAHSSVVALIALGVVGLGNALLDVSGFTLLQRLGDDRTMGRVFGVVYTVGIALSGIGAVVAPVLVHALGVRGALAVAGAVLPALALLSLRGLRRIDANSEPPSEPLRILAQLDLLDGLAPTTLEKLAARTEISTYDAGAVIVHEGQQADRFFVIVQGDVDVTSGGVLLNTLSAGEYFGEVGLMRQVPRTATVRATTSTEVASVAGAAFIDAVAGHELAFGHAFQVIDDRLKNDAAVKPR